MSFLCQKLPLIILLICVDVESSDILHHRVPRQNFEDSYGIQGPSQNPFVQNQQDDSTWPLASPDMPKITNIQVQCEKTHMRVSIEFDRPFSGLIFSKGHFSDPSCIHLQPGSGTVSTIFEIRLNQCGTTSSGTTQNNGQPNPVGSFVESTIIVQYDPLVQEVWDQARKLRCTWYDYYEKSVTFRPFQVNMLNAVTANFLGDNLQCWMQIQSGKGPWSSEVSGIVKIGQTMTMVLGIKDEENKFDMIVRNCVAHDGKRTPIQLVNELGCVIRPKIMSKFYKIKNFGPSANVVSYAYFQAFKFPDSMNVHFQCVIQVCRFNCPEPVCPDSDSSPALDNYGSPQTPNLSASTFPGSAVDSYSVQSSGPTLDNYGGPQVQPLQPQLPTYNNQPVPSVQDTYNGQFSAPAGPPPPPPPPPPPHTINGVGNFGDPRNAASGSSSPASGYEGPQRRRFPARTRFGHRQGKQDFPGEEPHGHGHFMHNNNVQNHRFKREVNITDGRIQTASVIRVLSTDDVAFKLNNDTNSDVVKNEHEGPTICVTLTNTSGLLFITFCSIIFVSFVTALVIGCQRRKTSSSKFKPEMSEKPKAAHVTPIPQKPTSKEIKSKK